MKISFVSSQAVSDAMRHSLLRMQSDLVKAEKEVATGRVADQGLALGAQTGRSVSLSRDIQRLGVMVDSNTLVGGRLATTQDALGQLADIAQSFLSTLTSSSSGNASSAVAKHDAEGTLSALTSILNSNLNGEYVFAGINTDIQPIGGFGAASPAKTAFDAAFVGYFGFTQADPAAANITAAAMTDFLATAVEPQFLGAGWSNWSTATDETISTRIALNETAGTSVSANTDGARKLAMAAAMVSDIFGGAVGENGREAIVRRALELVGSAVSDIASVQAEMGIVQQRVTSASERMEMQIDIFKRGVHDMEAIDPYEVSTRISSLLAQIETSYALTARIQQLSLVKYLS